MTAKKKQMEPFPGPDTTSNIDPGLQFDVPEITALWPDFVGNGKASLAKALVAAQAECQNVTMNKVNPHFRSKYADFSAVRDAVVPIFTKHGLSILQAPTLDLQIGFYLETRLIHTSGEEIIWKYPLPGDVTKPQAQGSAISYARRYTMSSLAAIASEEDDDANTAQNPNGGGSSGRGAVGSAQVGGSSPSTNGGIVL